MNNFKRLKLVNLLRQSIAHHRNFLIAELRYKNHSKSKRTIITNEIDNLCEIDKLLKKKYNKLIDIIYESPI